MMLFVVFAYLLLASCAQAEDQWKDVLKHRLVRNARLFELSRPNVNRRRTTTHKTLTLASSSSAALPVPVAPPTSPSASFTAFQNEALAQTNKHRAAHCAPNMVLDSELNRIAQAYATEMASAGRFQHSKNGHGENLYMTKSSEPIEIDASKASEAINAWYDEVTKYRWASPGFDTATGHFTQLVWASTIKFGIAFACSSDGLVCYVVANYSPPGNVVGQYPANVKQGSACA